MANTAPRHSLKVLPKLAALALGIAIVVTGCTPATDGGSGGATTPVDSLVLSGPNAPLTLDAAKAAEIASLTAIYLGQGQLFRWSEDQEPVPDLAESAVFADDGLSVTITLREGLTYSDDTPVVADDIKASFDHAKTGVVSSYLATMDSVEVVDDLTAIIRLNTTDPDVLRWLTGRALPINPADRAGDEAYYEAPVSAGPYVVDGWAAGNDRLTLVENPTYWQGPMMAKSLTILGVPDIASRVLQLSSGEIDFAWDVPLASRTSLPGDIRTSAGPIGGYNYLALNPTANPAFADPLVRQAVSLAIDRQAISDRAFFGAAPPLTSFLYSCGPLCEPGLLPNAGEQDLDAAKALLEEAGVTLPITADLMVSSSRPGWSDAAVVIAEQLAEIGIELSVKPVDEATWTGAVTSKNYQALYAGGAAPAQSALQQIFAKTGYWATAVGYSDDETTDLVAQAGATLDIAERTALFTEIQKIGADTMPLIPVLERVELVAQSAPEGLLVRAANTQIVNVQTVAQAEAGLGAGQYDD